MDGRPEGLALSFPSFFSCTDSFGRTANQSDSSQRRVLPPIQFAPSAEKPHMRAN